MAAGQAAGSMAGFAIPGGLASTGAARVAQMLAWGQRGTRIMRTAGMVAGGSGFESLIEGALHYQDVIDDGGTPDDASEQAARVAAQHFALTASTSGLAYGLPAATSTAGKLLQRGFQAVVESGQEAGQEAISNVAAGRPWQEHAANAAIVGLIAGPVTGVALERLSAAAAGPTVDRSGTDSGSVAPPTTQPTGRRDRIRQDLYEPPVRPVSPGSAAPVAPPDAVTTPTEAGNTAPDAVAEPHDYSSTQIMLPPDVSRDVSRLAAAIPNEDLAEDGREDAPHITVKYGLHDRPEVLENVTELLAGEPPITVTLGETSFFPNGESGNGDVVKLDVSSPDLRRLNAKIGDALPHTDTYPVYKPHATVAYVKTGLGEKYAGDATLKGRTVEIDRIVFAAANGQETEIPLRGRGSGSSPGSATTVTAQVQPAFSRADAETASVVASASSTADTTAVTRGTVDQGAGLPGVESERREARTWPESAGVFPQRQATQAPARTGQQRRVQSRARARQADADQLYAQVEADAVTQDSAVDRATLRREYDDRLAFLDAGEEFRAGTGRDPDVLLRAVAQAGGIGADPTFPGEVAWLREFADLATGDRSTGRVVAGVGGVFNKQGRPLSDIVESLQQDPQFSHIETADDLIEELVSAARGRGAAAPLTLAELSNAGIVRGTRWWDDAGDASFNVAEIEAPKESQPDLPGSAEIVAATSQQPQFDAPFSLQPDADTRRDIQPSLPETDDHTTSALPSRDLPDGPLPFRSRALKGAEEQALTPVAASQLRPDKVAKKLAAAINNIPVLVGKTARHRARALFKEPGLVRTQVAGDLHAQLHEIGHALDLIVMRWSAHHVRDDIARELTHIGEPTSLPSYSAPKRRREGVAEYTRRWLMDEDLTALREAAPDFTRVFEAFVAGGGPVARAFADGREQIQHFLWLSGAEQLETMIDMGDRSAGQILDDLGGRFFGTYDDPRTAFDKVVAVTSDDEYRLWQMEVATKGHRDIHPAESVYWSFRTLRGSAGKAQEFLYGNILGVDGRVIGPGLYNAIKPGIRKYRKLAHFFAAQRAQRAHERGHDTGFSDEAIAAGVDYGKDPDIAAAAKGYGEFRRAFLTYAVERGILTPEMRRLWEQKWGDTYVPFHWVGNTVQGTGRPGPKQNARWPWRRFPKEKFLPIDDPIRATVQDVFRVVGAAEENARMNELLDLAGTVHTDNPRRRAWIELLPAEQSPVRFNLSQVRKDIVEDLGKHGIKVPDSVTLDPTFLDRFATIWQPHTVAQGGTRYITAIGRDGKRRWGLVHDEGIWDMLVKKESAAVHAIVATLQPAARLLRSTATLNLPFMVRNVIRDVASAKFYNPTGFSFWRDWTGGVASILTKDDSWQRFMASGAAQSTFNAQDRNLLKREVGRLGTTGVRRFLDQTVFHPFDGLAALREITEYATRVGAVRRHLRTAGHLDEAMMRHIGVIGREVTQDFSKMGSAVREWNKTTAFLGARIGGWTRAMEEARVRPALLSRRVAPYFVLSLALWALHQDDDEFDEVPGWERATYHHIPVPQELRDEGWGPFVRIPRPFEFGDMSNWAEAFLDWKVREDKEFKDRLPFTGGVNSLKELMLLMVPNLLLPPLEVTTNHDTFRERSIVSPFDDGLDPALQYNRWTSETAKRLGRVMDASPAKIDHMIYGYTAGLGRAAVEQADRLFTASGYQEPSRGIESWPGVRAIYGGSSLATSSASINQFYEELERLEGAAGSIRRYIGSGETATAAKVAASNGLTTRLVGERIEVTSPRRTALNDAREALRDRKAEMDRIYKSQTMSSAEKRRALDRLVEGMVNITRVSLGKSTMTRTTRRRD